MTKGNSRNFAVSAVNRWKERAEKEKKWERSKANQLKFIPDLILGRRHYSQQD